MTHNYSKINIFAFSVRGKRKEVYRYEVYIKDGGHLDRIIAEDRYSTLDSSFFSDLRKSLSKYFRIPPAISLQNLVSERPYILDEHEINPRTLNGAEWVKVIEGVMPPKRKS